MAGVGVKLDGVGRKVAVLVAAAVIAAVPAVSIAATDHVAAVTITVKPASGSHTTGFVVSFRSPDRTGRAGSFDRRDELSVHGPPGPAGCVTAVSRMLPTAGAHARVTALLNPAELGGRWCAGAYHGRIVELQRPACAGGTACPMFVSVLRTLGSFGFRVTGGGQQDTTPPTFSGLQRAFACAPGPQLPGETTPFHLSWTAATDNVTPTAEIVYDVFMATTPGGEDFSHATWTTPPGVTRFTTPGLPSHGVVYFVVRARDRAGNEDQNHMEKSGIDPCV
jgi:hypothetical protein